MTKTLLLLPLSLPLVACSSAPPLKTPELAQARTVVVEITDTHPGVPARVSTVPLSLVEERGQSQYEVSSRNEKLKIEAVADRKGPASVVQVRFYRWRRNDQRDSSSEVSFNDHAVWQAGARTVLGTTSTDDGGATEVAFTMK